MVQYYGHCANNTQGHDLDGIDVEWRCQKFFYVVSLPAQHWVWRFQLARTVALSPILNNFRAGPKLSGSFKKALQVIRTQGGALHRNNIMIPISFERIRALFPRYRFFEDCFLNAVALFCRSKRAKNGLFGLQSTDKNGRGWRVVVSYKMAPRHVALRETAALKNNATLRIRVKRYRPTPSCCSSSPAI